MSGPDFVSHDDPAQPLSSAEEASSDSDSLPFAESEVLPHGEEVENSEEQFVISVAAERAGMHAQTLRSYDRLGLVRPLRTKGGGRRYTRHDIEDLREIQKLSQEAGINLAGIKRILELRRRIEYLENKLKDCCTHKNSPGMGRELIVRSLIPGTAVEVWRPRQRHPHGRSIVS